MTQQQHQAEQIVQKITDLQASYANLQSRLDALSAAQINLDHVFATLERKQAAALSYTNELFESQPAHDYSYAIREALSRQDFSPAIRDALSEYNFGDELTAAIDNYDFSPAIRDALSEYNFEDLDFSDAISTAIDEHDFGDTISNALNEHDFGDTISNALNEHDFGDTISEKIDAHYFGDKIRDAIQFFDFTAKINETLAAQRKQRQLVFPTDAQLQTLITDSTNAAAFDAAHAVISWMLANNR